MAMPTEPVPSATSASYPIVYANSALVTCTAEEVQIEFGLRSNRDPTAHAPMALVITSFPHAKRLAAALQSQIERYERMFGPVPMDMAEKLTDDARADLARDGGAIEQ